MKEKNKFKKFGVSKFGMFKPIDVLIHPHLYCITPKHIEYSDGMYLDIEKAEEKGAVCDICKKINKEKGTPILSHKEHKQILLIGCKEDIKNNKELKEYLLKIKKLAEKEGYIGFAFKESF